MAASVQFSGVINVLDAFDNRGLDYWSIFQGKQFLFKGVGQSDLETVLNALKAGGSTSVYTLKVYEGINDLSDIKNKTEDSGSFNFRLSMDELYPDRSMGGGMFGLLDTRMKSLEEKIDLLKVNDEVESIDEQPEKTAIGEIMGNPAVAALIPLLIERIIDYLVPKKKIENAPTLTQINPPLRAVSGIPVVDQLKEYDPSIEIHLQKLLQIAKSNRPFFDALINSLNSIEL